MREKGMPERLGMEVQPLRAFLDTVEVLLPPRLKQQLAAAVEVRFGAWDGNSSVRT